MPKRSLPDKVMIEQLDQAVSQLLAAPKAKLHSEDPGLLPLLRVAAALRQLPREEFKARLKSDLERSTSMSTPAVKPIREGFRTITPYLIVEGAVELIDFVKQAFGAEEL